MFVLLWDDSDNGLVLVHSYLTLACSAKAWPHAWILLSENKQAFEPSQTHKELFMPLTRSIHVYWLELMIVAPVFPSSDWAHHVMHGATKLHSRTSTWYSTDSGSDCVKKKKLALCFMNGFVDLYRTLTGYFCLNGFFWCVWSYNWRQLYIDRVW